jgi:hypothetical protein
MGERRSAYSVLVGKHEGKRPLGRPRHRWVDNIEMDLQDGVTGHKEQDSSTWGTGLSIRRIWLLNVGNKFGQHGGERAYQDALFWVIPLCYVMLNTNEVSQPNTTL